MSNPRVHSIWFTLANVARFLFWLALLGVVVMTFYSRSIDLQSARAQILQQFQEERKSRVIAMIHRQERAAVLGVPVTSHIDIEDSEAARVRCSVRRADAIVNPKLQPAGDPLHTLPGVGVAYKLVQELFRLAGR